ncbi:MAG: hypothetical protein QXQ40_01240 [Candidatus Aenigmatarchaeota archaeon]
MTQAQFRKSSKKFGRYGISTHAINRYKERVIDDPGIDRYSRRDIEHKIRKALNEIYDIESLPKINFGYIAEVQFKVKDGKTRPYYVILERRSRYGNDYAVKTILTKEMYEDLLNEELKEPMQYSST